MGRLLTGLLFFRALLRLMAANSATRRSSKKTVMVRIMAGDAADERALKAALGLGGGAGSDGGDQNRGEDDGCFHCGGAPLASMYANAEAIPPVPVADGACRPLPL